MTVALYVQILCALIGLVGDLVRSSHTDPLPADVAAVKARLLRLIDELPFHDSPSSTSPETSP